MSKTTKTIVKGPSKDAMFDALKNYKSINAPRVQFSIEKGIAQEVAITGISLEDGSGESWNIQGRARAMIKGTAVTLPDTQVRIYFRTDTRRGYMKDSPLTIR